MLSVLPPFHIYSLTSSCCCGIRLGAELVLHVRFDPEAALRDIEAKKITLFPGVPTMFVAMLNLPAARRRTCIR